MQRDIDAIRAIVEHNDDIQVLLANSTTWGDGRTEAEQRSRRTAWRVAFGMGGITLIALGIAAGAIQTSLQPAPTPEVLVLDRATGKTEPLVSLTEIQKTPEEATIRRDITTFVRARENYSFDMVEQNYRDAAAFMSPQLQAQWAAFWDTNNPATPLAIYKKDGKVRVDIGAITINRNTDNVATSVRVNFTKTIKRGDQLVGPVTAWIATIPFHYANVSTTEAERRINPLGIVFPDYQTDIDVGAAIGAAPIYPPPAQPVTATATQAMALSAPQIPIAGVKP